MKKNAASLNSPTKSGITKFKAEYTFEASREDELSIKAGDIINVDLSIKTDEGWMWGECQGRTGVFPAAFTVKLNELDAIQDESNLFNNNNFGQQQQPQNKQNVIII